MGRLISSFVLVSLVGAALAFNTIEHSREVQNRIDQSRDFFSNALGVVLPESYAQLVTKMHVPSKRAEERCLTLEVEQIEQVLQRIEHNHVATLSGTPISMPDGKQLILLEDPNGILIEVVGS
jgi:hypothetical protein